MSIQDESRFRFILSLFSLPERSRSHLLRVESDAELAELKRVALDAQHFEMAAAIAAEAKRRTAEIPVTQP